MKNLFPPNNIIHTMVPRIIEPFQVLKAKTERLKNSPIIFMQNLLNTEANRKIAQDKLWSGCQYTLSSVNFSLYYCDFAVSITEINPLLLYTLYKIHFTLDTYPFITVSFKFPQSLPRAWNHIFKVELYLGDFTKTTY